MWDFARVLNVEEHLRWQKYGAFMENRFGIKLEEWQSLTRRLVIALDAGLEAFDAVRKAHKEATKDSEPLPEKMVKTVPRDWMKLYQKAWVLLVSLVRSHQRENMGSHWAHRGLPKRLRRVRPEGFQPTALSLSSIRSRIGLPSSNKLSW